MTVNNLPASVDGATHDAAKAARTRARNLHVRLFEERDISKAREIMHQHHAATVFRDQPFSDWKLNEHMSRILSRPPRMLGATAEYCGTPAGLAWAMADSYMLSDGPLFVTVQLIAVDLTLGPVRRARIFLALIAAIRQWARSLNASHIFVHVTTGSAIAATDRLLKEAGAQFIGGAYVL